MSAAPDRLTVITTAGRDRGKLATKRITLDADGRWQIQDYSLATWWSVRRLDVHDLLSLGDALASLEHERSSCVIRGEPLPGIDPACTRRLKDAAEDGTPPSFASSARRWIGLDFDSLPTPVWDIDELARRGIPAPDPIDPVRDWPLSIRAAVITLPSEFHDASAWWQMTSGAGIKPGIRLRLFYWCDRPVSDDEAKRWLKGSPVDTSFYCAVTPHYTAAPIFAPPKLDPVPQRSGFWWRHTNTVAVPDLTEKPKPRPSPAPRRFTGDASAERYAQACINGIVAAPDGQGRAKAIAVARLLYGMANHGLLDPANVTAALTEAMHARGWGQTERGRWSQAEIERHLAYARAHADTDLPQGFR